MEGTDQDVWGTMTVDRHDGGGEIGTGGSESVVVDSGPEGFPEEYQRDDSRRGD